MIQQEKIGRVALVHDWLTGMRGGERLLEVVCGMFPQADLYTLVHVPGSVTPVIEDRRIFTSALQKLPGVERHFRKFLPFFPRLIERFDLSGYDFVLSISHCVAKGVVPRPGAVHLCYCNTPMRYIWDMYEQYLGKKRKFPPARWAASALRARLQTWDVKSSERVTHFVGNSHNVADRIRRHYGREADVIHPFVDCDRFRIADRPEDFYLIVSALVPYKKVDLAVQAFSELGRPLKVVGTGPELGGIRQAAGPNVEFLGWKGDDEVAGLLSKCRALIFPGEEDFGIVPLEAMACGRPVIAYGKGGVTETVTEETGVFFQEQTAEALAEGVRRFESVEERFLPEKLRQRALEFDRPVFRRRMEEKIREVLKTAPNRQ